MLPNCCSIRCEISYASWWFIVWAHAFSLAEWNFEEKSPFVQANYRSICREISCELSSELSSKNHGNKERNSRISLALLLHNTVVKSCIWVRWPIRPVLIYSFIAWSDWDKLQSVWIPLSWVKGTTHKATASAHWLWTRMWSMRYEEYEFYQTLWYKYLVF